MATPAEISLNRLAECFGALKDYLIKPAICMLVKIEKDVVKRYRDSMKQLLDLFSS